MNELIAFSLGFIIMGILCYWMNYLDSGSAYRRGYRQALEDEILIRKRMKGREEENLEKEENNATQR